LRIIFLSTFEKWQKSFAGKFSCLSDSGGMPGAPAFFGQSTRLENKIR